MLDLGARCEYYAVKGFRQARSFQGIPQECTVVATYDRPSPFVSGAKPVKETALTHPYVFPHWTTALHMISRWFDLDEERLLETVISRWLDPDRRSPRLFPWFDEEFTGADPAEALGLLPGSLIQAVRDDAALTFPDGCRSLDGQPLGGEPLGPDARAETVRLLTAMQAAWSRDEWLIALDEGSQERLISFQEIEFDEGGIVEPTDVKRLHMHNYGQAVLLSQTMRKHLGFSAATWLIWGEVADPFSEESLSACAPQKALERVNDTLIDGLERSDVAPALGDELRAELIEWLRALVSGWNEGYWVMYSV